MALLCKLFGHKPQDYGWVTGSQTDGIGRTHLSIRAECRRCEETYHLCNIHLPEEYVERQRFYCPMCRRPLSFKDGEPCRRCAQDVILTTPKKK